MRRDNERLYVFAIIAVTAALLGSLVGLAAALLVSREPPPRLPALPPPIEPPAPVASDAALDRMIDAIEHPRRAPEPAPNPVQVAKPWREPHPRVIAVVCDEDGTPTACVVQTHYGEQCSLSPGEGFRGDTVVSIRPTGKGAVVYFREQDGEVWTATFDPSE